MCVLLKCCPSKQVLSDISSEALDGSVSELVRERNTILCVLCERTSERDLLRLKLSFYALTQSDLPESERARERESERERKREKEREGGRAREILIISLCKRSQDASSMQMILKLGFVL